MTLWLMLAGLALAQEDPEFQETVKEIEVAKKPEGEASAEFGGSLVTGNSEFYQLTGRMSGGYKWKKNRVSALADALWGQGYVDLDESGTLEDAERAGNRVETARRFNAEGRYDRFFGEKNSLYFLAGAFHDPFSGYDLRSHEQLGYSRTLIDNDTTNMVIEIGADWAQENYVEGVDPNYLDVIAVREMVAIKHAFTESFSIEEIFEAYENVLLVADVRINNSFGISAKLSDKISLKASHALRFDNVPVEGFRKNDQTVLLTLVATLFKTKAPEPPAEPAPCPCPEETPADGELEDPVPEEDTPERTVTLPDDAAEEASDEEEGTTKTAPRGGADEAEEPAPE